ncbi:putative DNA modification/repair radical SAM protein [Candidatus Micrarchaeota archaeon RBG_16_49_10]|nr:MAG: putative DNA modification/repair radical SAM protein [Candidatus Micrarchaeota archaeon RBG_16_49_10]
MNVIEKVKILGAAGKFDVCASTASCRKTPSLDRVGSAVSSGICHSFTPDGRCVSLFKVLYTNSCSFDCKYCPNTCSGRKASFEPEELGNLFISLYLGNYVEGLFLSSGIAGDPDRVSEKMIETVNFIRERHKFRGYVHSKVLPGTDYSLVKALSEVSDRMSVNVETPSKARMGMVSSNKEFKSDILRRQAWIKRLASRKNLPAGQTTQFIVGASGESDLEILRLMDWEYRQMKVKRCYFSAFSPVKETALEGKERTPIWRENRLYQCDWLLRKYGFPLGDLKNVMDGEFLANEAPKLLMARQTLDSPVDVNECSFEDLIKVPGIGLVTAKRILGYRKKDKVKGYEELRNMGVVLKRARPFIEVAGKHQRRLGDFL